MAWKAILKNWREIKIFCNKQKLGKFMTTKPTLQKVLKRIWNTEEEVGNHEIEWKRCGSVWPERCKGWKITWRLNFIQLLRMQSGCFLGIRELHVNSNEPKDWSNLSLTRKGSGITVSMHLECMARRQGRIYRKAISRIKSQNVPFTLKRLLKIYWPVSYNHLIIDLHSNQNLYINMLWMLCLYIFVLMSSSLQLQLSQVTTVSLRFCLKKIPTVFSMIELNSISKESFSSSVHLQSHNEIERSHREHIRAINHILEE